MPENPTQAQPAIQPALARPPHRGSFALWVTENRYMFCGVVCMLVAVLSLTISISAASVYISLFGLSLVFGVLAVMDRKPIRGLLLILVVTILGSIFWNYLFEQRISEELRKLEQWTKSLEELIRK